MTDRKVFVFIYYMYISIQIFLNLSKHVYVFDQMFYFPSFIIQELIPKWEQCFISKALYVSLRFTELYVEELENEADLRILISDYLKCLNPHRSVISGIIRLALINA